MTPCRTARLVYRVWNRPEADVAELFRSLNVPESAEPVAWQEAMAACAAGAAQTGLQIPRRPPAGRRGCSLRCPLWGERLRRALPEAASPAAAVLNAKRQAGPLVAGRRAALSVTCASRFKTLVDFLLGGPAESREREEAVSRQYRRTVFDFPARPRLCRARPLFFLSRSQ